MCAAWKKLIQVDIAAAPLTSPLRRLDSGLLAVASVASVAPDAADAFRSAATSQVVTPIYLRVSTQEEEEEEETCFFAVEGCVRVRLIRRRAADLGVGTPQLQLRPRHRRRCRRPHPCSTVLNQRGRGRPVFSRRERNRFAGLPTQMTASPLRQFVAGLAPSFRLWARAFVTLRWQQQLPKEEEEEDIPFRRREGVCVNVRESLPLTSRPSTSTSSAPARLLLCSALGPPRPSQEVVAALHVAVAIIFKINRSTKSLAHVAESRAR